MPSHNKKQGSDGCRVRHSISKSSRRPTSGSSRLFDGGVIFAKGDSADCAYIIQSGTVEIRGVGCAIEVIGRGEIFGVCRAS